MRSIQPRSAGAPPQRPPTAVGTGEPDEDPFRDVFETLDAMTMREVLSFSARVQNYFNHRWRQHERNLDRGES